MKKYFDKVDCYHKKYLKNGCFVLTMTLKEDSGISTEDTKCLPNSSATSCTI